MAKTFLEMLAPVVQGPKSGFCDLHHRCNGPKAVFPFAPMVQETKSGFFCLHHRCKRQKEVFEVCTAGASVPKNTLTVTARYPRHSSGIRNLILSSNSRKCKQTRVKRGSPMLLSLLSYTFCWKRTRVFPQKGILLRYEIYSNATKLEGTPTAVTMGVCEHSPVLVL